MPLEFWVVCRLVRRLVIARRSRRRIALADHYGGVSRDNESWCLFSERIYDEDVDA